MKNKKILFLILIILITFAVGVLGYHIIEDLPYFESLYMTVITISTVGFTEVKTLSRQGRVLTMILIFTSMTIIAYSVSSILKMLVDGHFTANLRRNRLLKEINNLKNHYIICGFGRIGNLIANELEKHNIKFVIIDKNPKFAESMETEKYLFLNMDATLDETLNYAGIMNAKGIVTTVESDADNVFITLTARNLNPALYILSRASDERSEIKLKRAGASKVVLPYFIGGQRMAEAIIRPTVVDFIDITMSDKHLGLVMEEVEIFADSRLVGRNLVESNLRKDFGVIIVAIKKLSGNMIFNPTFQEVLEAGDVIVVLGQKGELDKIRARV